MEIILKEDIIGLGYKNDIVNVKNGYGRNYLIPQGKGVIASESAKKVLAENLKQQAHKLAVLKAEAEKPPEVRRKPAKDVPTPPPPTLAEKTRQVEVEGRIEALEAEVDEIQQLAESMDATRLAAIACGQNTFPG